jgi:hypothetical protein
VTSWPSQEANLNGVYTNDVLDNKMPTQWVVRRKRKRMMNDFVKQNLTRPYYFSELINVVFYKFVIYLRDFCCDTKIWKLRELQKLNVKTENGLKLVQRKKILLSSRVLKNASQLTGIEMQMILVYDSILRGFKFTHHKKPTSCDKLFIVKKGVVAGTMLDASIINLFEMECCCCSQ